MNTQSTDPAEISIQEGDRLIAEFDGWTIEPGMDNDPDPFFNQPHLAGCIPRMVLVSEMKFHSSWDWLMPVWKKMATIMYDTRDTLNKEEYLEANTLTVKILKTFQKVDIDSAFLFIVESVQWYNKTIKQ